jgi:hypothetical protein
MKRFLMACVIAGLLAVSAFAGDVSTSGSPAPAPSGATETTKKPGDIPSDGKSELSSEALSALLSVLCFLGV